MSSIPRLAILLLTASVAVASAVIPAQARWNERDDRGHDQHHWNGGYRQPPPVIYRQPYGGYGYLPPPVIYAPSVGIVLPNLFIGIH